MSKNINNKTNKTNINKTNKNEKVDKIIDRDFLSLYIKDGRILRKDFKDIYKKLDRPFFITFPDFDYNENTYKFYKDKKNIEKNILSPMSGFEPVYDPDKWNLNPTYKLKNNCYSFALNKPAHKRLGKGQPGYSSKVNISNDDNKEYKCERFYHRIKKDNPTMYLTSFDEKCSPGFHKSFLAIDLKEDKDYHFWRQDKNGYFSHKPGLTNVTNLDASGKKIKNPLKSDRNFTHYQYKKPCFFFCSNPKTSHAHSK
jgi:hypothetical protein